MNTTDVITNQVSLFRDYLTGSTSPTPNDRYYDQAWNFWNLPKDCRIIDIGPGSTNGRDAFEWAKRHKGKIIYLDNRSHIVEAVNHLAGELGYGHLEARLISDSGSIGEISLADAVILYGTLNQERDIGACLKGIASSLKKGGVLAIGGTTCSETDRDTRIWSSNVKMALTDYRSLNRGIKNELISTPRYYHTYNQQVRALFDSGFSVERWLPIEHRNRRAGTYIDAPALLRLLTDENRDFDEKSEEISDEAFLALARNEPSGHLRSSAHEENLEAYHNKMRELYLTQLRSLSSWSRDDVVLIVEPSGKTAERAIIDMVGRAHTVTPAECPQNIAGSKWTCLVLWGACQRLEDLEGILEEFTHHSTGDSRVVCMDAFLPVTIRDWWSWASWVKDPSTVAHRTYHEYMRAFRAAGFSPQLLQPFRHTADLDRWTRATDSRTAGLREMLIGRILHAPEQIRSEINLKSISDSNYEFTYDAFIMLAKKEAL